MNTEARKRRLVEADPSVRSLEEFVDSLFKAKSENINASYMERRRLSTHLFELRLGDRRLRLLPAGHRLLRWDGVEVNVLWNDQGKRWEVVGLTKICEHRKVEIKRTGDDTTITIQPINDKEFWMGDVIYRFGNGIVRLDEALQPLGNQRVEPYQLGGVIRLEIDKDSLAFISMHADERDIDPFYCLYMKKNQPLAKGLCEPMVQLLGKYFGSILEVRYEK